MPGSSPAGGFGRTLARVFAALAATLLAIAGLVLMVGALLVGAAVAGGLYLWARLRGRPLGQASFAWRHAAARQAQPGERGPAGRSRSAEVVDVEVTEVTRAAGTTTTTTSTRFSEVIEAPGPHDRPRRGPDRDA